MPYEPQLRFDDLVAVITGAGGGLGRAHALELGRRGAKVVVNDVGGDVSGNGQDPGAADAVVDQIAKGGGTAVADYHSVATPDGGSAVIQTALDAFGGVDILINNAGILRDRSFHKMGPDLVDPVLDVHLRGAFNVTRPAWQIMRERRRGVIVNTTSSAGLIGNPGQANYGAAKMGLVGLTNVLAAEGRRHGLRVNAIAPLARTRMTESLMGEFAAVVDPEYVTALAVALAHPTCPVNGRVYTVGGGRVARFLIGMNDGWFDRDRARSAEHVLANLDAIDDVACVTIPEAATDELQILKDLLKSAPT